MKTFGQGEMILLPDAKTDPESLAEHAENFYAVEAAIHRESTRIKAASRFYFFFNTQQRELLIEHLTAAAVEHIKHHLGPVCCGLRRGSEVCVYREFETVVAGVLGVVDCKVQSILASERTVLGSIYLFFSRVTEKFPASIS